jgi:hypothetical protein
MISRHDHAGIAAAQSFKLALIFCTTPPLYNFLAFTCDAAIGSLAWFLAAAIALRPLFFAVSETWPLSPVHLFMWSGHQARSMSRLLMLGDTRLVLGTRQCTAATALDCPVRPHGLVGGSSSGGSGMTGLLELHDAVMRVIGFTLLQGDGDVHRAVLALLASGAKDAPLRGNCVTLSDAELMAVRHCSTALDTLQRWLASTKRLVEARSGLPLERVLYVRVGADGRVVEVLHASEQQE